MNTPLTRSKSSGFTLIEILVAVAIIALLATLAVGWVKSAQERANSRGTEQRKAWIVSKLEDYRQHFGEYPEPADEATTVEITGGSFKCGGAMCIYQAITADGNDQIKGFRVNTNRGESSGASRGEPGWTNVQSFAVDMNNDNQTKGWYKQVDGKYMLMDAFNHPWQYKKSQGPKDEDIHNQDSFDLWSYGALKGPQEGTEAEKAWIKNW